MLPWPEGTPTAERDEKRPGSRKRMKTWSCLFDAEEKWPLAGVSGGWMVNLEPNCMRMNLWKAPGYF